MNVKNSVIISSMLIIAIPSISSMHTARRLARPIAAIVRQQAVRSFAKKAIRPIVSLAVASTALIAMHPHALAKQKEASKPATAATGKSHIIELTAENIESVLQQATKPVVIKFHADWCKPCKEMSPLFDQLAQTGEYTCCAVNLDTEPEIAEKYDVDSIPSFVVIQKGEETGRVEEFETDFTMFEKSIEHAVNVDITKLSKDELTKKLFEAIKKNSIPAVMRYGKAGADINGTHTVGSNFPITPLMATLMFSQSPDALLATSKYLLEAGADTTVELEPGKSIDIIEMCNSMLTALKKETNPNKDAYITALNTVIADINAARQAKK